MRLFEATLCLPHLSQFWERGCQGCRLQDPLGPSSPAVAFFILLSMRGCGSLPESIPRVSLCLTLPFCILRAFYSSHCSANVTIVRLLGRAQDEESDFPVGRREGSLPPTWFVDPRAVQWLCQGALAEWGTVEKEDWVLVWCGSVPCGHPQQIPQVVMTPSVGSDPFSHLRVIPFFPACFPFVASGTSMNILLPLLICLLIW